MILLPSGRRVRVDVATRGAPLRDDRFRGEVLRVGGRLLAAVDDGSLRVVADAGGDPLVPGDLDDWPLRDFHALRDVAMRLGAIGEEPPELSCRNCDAPLDADPRSAPTKDLDAWYAPGRSGGEDAFAGGAVTVPLSRPLRLPRGHADRITLEPVTVAAARPLWRALATADAPPATAAVVRALGVRSVGPLRTPRRLARALEDAPEDVWRVIEAAFLLANYAPEGVRPVACRRCGTVHDVDAPSERELPFDADAEAFVLGDRGALAARDAPTDVRFPEADAFDALTARVAEEVFAAMGVRNLELVVDHGTPPVDGSGEPLLASYRPVDAAHELGLAATGHSDLRFRVEVYPRTFARMFEDEPYDVEAELRETLEHEVEHHLHYLAGHDPMDEAEREEALRDLERTYGPRHVAAARRRAAAGELAEFARFALPILLLAAAVAAIAALLSGR